MENWLTIVVVGVGTGLGSALGNYFAQRHVITRVEQIEKKILENKNYLTIRSKLK
ncbi:hypothetical protein J4468_04425 [Candidatus Woesearchaeota archaeon]|nr:hypothetical protein [Candidatus Woesearchaeota archaeon]